MEVDPTDVIFASKGARILNKGSTALFVTITGNVGQPLTIEVPPNGDVLWYPPPDWRSARFNASGHTELFRMIDQDTSV